MAVETVRYTNANGRIVAERRNSVRRYYAADPLGSTKALYSGQTQTDTFTYWPYGELRTRTGGTSTPFQFVGTFGYYLDATAITVYVRARYYQPQHGRWMTVDPIWPWESAYRYVRLNPSTYHDSSGLIGSRDCAKEYADCIKSWDDVIKDCQSDASTAAGNQAIVIGLIVGIGIALVPVTGGASLPAGTTCAIGVGATVITAGATYIVINNPDDCLKLRPIRDAYCNQAYACCKNPTSVFCRQAKDCHEQAVQRCGSRHFQPCYDIELKKCVDSGKFGPPPTKWF